MAVHPEEDLLEVGHAVTTGQVDQTAPPASLADDRQTAPQVVDQDGQHPEHQLMVAGDGPVHQRFSVWVEPLPMPMNPRLEIGHERHTRQANRMRPPPRAWAEVPTRSAADGRADGRCAMDQDVWAVFELLTSLSFPDRLRPGFPNTNAR